MPPKEVRFGARPRPQTEAEWLDAPPPRQADVVEHTPADAPAKLKRLTLDMDEALHRDFKAVCARRGITMRDRLLELVREDVRT